MRCVRPSMRAILLRISPLPFYCNTFSFPLSHRRTCVFFGPTTPVPRYESRDPREKRARRCLWCVHFVYVCVSVSRNFLHIRDECVCADKSARAPPGVCVWENARGVCTRRCERECFTPDYYVSRASDRTNVEKRSRARGKTRVTPKITLTNTRIYRATLTALGRAESIYFVRTVCAANTVG